MRTHVTQDGDMVDEIAWKTYPAAGQAAAITLIYEANAGLAERGPVLPGGLVVILPDVAAPIVERQTRIWG